MHPLLRLRRAFFDLPGLKWAKDRLYQNELAVAALQNQVRKVQAEVAVFRHQDRIQQLFAFLRPQEVIGVKKIRLGSKQDGGYVMLNDFDSVSAAYSLGIEREVSWDMEIVNRGIPVQQFDYSIPREPVTHPLITFFPKKIEKITDLNLRDGNKQILKIDIETYEWEFFDSAPENDLKRFSQIVGEFHCLDLFHDDGWWKRARNAFEKLNTTHQLIHIHGNNIIPHAAFWAGEVVLPFYVELTFASRLEYRFKTCSEDFPGPLDFPNQPGIEDYALNPLVYGKLAS